LSQCKILTFIAFILLTVGNPEREGGREEGLKNKWRRRRRRRPERHKRRRQKKERKRRFAFPSPARHLAQSQQKMENSKTGRHAAACNN
jgi:hypothetical protein